MIEDIINAQKNDPSSSLVRHVSKIPRDGQQRDNEHLGIVFSDVRPRNEFMKIIDTGIGKPLNKIEIPNPDETPPPHQMELLGEKFPLLGLPVPDTPTKPDGNVTINPIPDYSGYTDTTPEAKESVETLDLDDLEITFICDRSGSMGNGDRWKAQQDAMLKMMDGLESNTKLAKKIKTEIY